MKYEVGVTVNLPEDIEIDMAFFNLPWDMIVKIIEEDYPTMTSFTLICTPIKED